MILMVRIVWHIICSLGVLELRKISADDSGPAYGEMITCESSKDDCLDRLSTSVKCSSIQFQEAPIGNSGQKVYKGIGIAKLTWMESVCCCRSRGYHLLSTVSFTHCKDVYKALNTLGVVDRSVGWADLHYYNGRWESFFSRMIPEPETWFTGASSATGENLCGNAGVNTTTSSMNHGVKINQTCNNSMYEEYLVCESRNTTLNRDCFGQSSTGFGPQECTEENVIRYAKTRQCEPENVITPPGGSENCTRNCFQHGYCEKYWKCIPINREWDWDSNRELFVGKWGSFNCPGSLVWNSDTHYGINGSCDYFKHLSPELRKQYKTDNTCWKECHFKEHDEKSFRCSGKFFFVNRINDTTRELGTTVLKQCPAGLVFNSVLKTCTKCQDAPESVRKDCCNN